jgi:hypothetical protein
MAADLKIIEAVVGATDVTQGRVSHHYGPVVVISEVDRAFVSTKAAAASAPGMVADATGNAGLAAFQLRQSTAYQAAKAARPHDGVNWDSDGVEGLLPPNPPETLLLALRSSAVGSLSAAAAVATPTSQQLTGKVAVGVVIVSGPGDLAFSNDEIVKVHAEVQNGLSWLGSQTGTATPVQFYYDLRNVTLTLPDDPNGSDKEGYWRNPTMAALGFANPLAYVESIRSSLGTDWAYCAFFVKYSQTWFAYAFLGGPYLCMQYANDGWGPDNIDRVFAHESGHIFNAPDEYTASNCNCTSTYGIYGVVNGNCQTCAPGGGVACIMQGNSWSMCAYTPWHLGCPAVGTLWSSSNMGQGPGAVSWLVGDVNGDGRAEIIQPWANGGSLGMIVYGGTASALSTLWSSGDMGQGPGAVSWLIGDVNGDGRPEVIQLWANGGSLGMIVYGWSGSGMTTLWSSSNMGQGPGAVSWLIGDVNGDGKAEIIQQWANGGSLGTIVYGWSSGAMSTLWSSSNMGQGPGAVSWLIGDVNGDGCAEIVQQWANGGSLGTIVYGWVSGAMTTLWASSNMGQGPGAVGWLIGDVNGDGRAEIIQQWANGGSLGTIVYGWVSGAMTTLWTSSNMGQGPGAVSWLIGDINGDGRPEIVQQWANGSSLGTIVYGWQSGQMAALWCSSNMSQGPGAVAWLMGDINGDGRQEIIQQWANGGSLGSIVYGYLKKP